MADGTEAAALEASGVSSFPARSMAQDELTRFQLVNTLQGHVDDLRSMLQCGICIRPLYEPFTLACGHTFCYSVRFLARPSFCTSSNFLQCLSSWFSGGRSKRTCPDCRAPVKTQPAPAYLVWVHPDLFRPIDSDSIFY